MCPEGAGFIKSNILGLKLKDWLPFQIFNIYSFYSSDIVIAKFILGLFLLQTLAAFLPSFKMLCQG